MHVCMSVNATRLLWYSFKCLENAWTSDEQIILNTTNFVSPSCHAIYKRNGFFAHTSRELIQEKGHVLGAVCTHCEPKIGSYTRKLKAGVETHLLSNAYARICILLGKDTSWAGKDAVLTARRIRNCRGNIIIMPVEWIVYYFRGLVWKISQLRVLFCAMFYVAGTVECLNTRRAIIRARGRSDFDFLQWLCV